MKTKILSILTPALLILATGCSDDPNYIMGETDGGEGTLSLADLTADVNTDQIEMGRAGEIDTDAFIISVTNAEGANVYTSTMADRNEVVTLPAATGYNIRIYSHEQQDVAWEAPYYEGNKDFDIQEGQITAIGVVECKFANIRVSIRYDEKLQAMLGTDVRVTVSCSQNGSSIDFTPTETRSAYFKAGEGSSTLIATLSGTVKGQQVLFTRALSDVQAGHHRIVNFKVNDADIVPPDEKGTIDLGDGLSLDAEVQNEDVNGNLTVDEDPLDGERPGKEDPLEEEEPDHGGNEDPVGPVDPVVDAIVMDAPGMSFTDVMDVPQAGEPAINGIVNITTNEGLAALKVVIGSSSSEFIGVLGDVGVPTDFDLAHVTDSAVEAAFRGFNFPMNGEILNQKNVVFDISNFIPLLNLYAGEHTFTLTVEDNAGNSLSKVLTFRGFGS